MGGTRLLIRLYKTNTSILKAHGPMTMGFAVILRSTVFTVLIWFVTDFKQLIQLLIQGAANLNWFLDSRF